MVSSIYAIVSRRNPLSLLFRAITDRVSPFRTPPPPGVLFFLGAFLAYHLLVTIHGQISIRRGREKEKHGVNPWTGNNTSIYIRDWFYTRMAFVNRYDKVKLNFIVLWKCRHVVGNILHRIWSVLITRTANCMHRKKYEERKNVSI